MIHDLIPPNLPTEVLTRRLFLSQVALASGGIGVLASTTPVLAMATDGLAEGTFFRRYVAQVSNESDTRLPDRVRIPLGKMAFAVTDKGTVRLRFPALIYRPGTYALRLTAATDFRDEKLVRVTLAETGEELGTFDLRFSHPFQPFELPIASTWLPQIRRQGLALRLTEGTEAWFLTAAPGMEAFQGLVPQLLESRRPGNSQTFMTNLYSMNAFSPFGWQGGAVIDGLYELSRTGDANAQVALDRYLALFLDDQKGIIYENPMTVPIDGTFNSIEDFLPFACIADRHPNHVSVKKATDYLLARKNNDGLIITGDVTTEGCYTIAYPLAMIAKKTGDAQLAQIALDQLWHRMRFLTDERAIYQRSSYQGRKAYRNWGRGTAWYMLGLIKTLSVLQEGGFTSLTKLDAVRDSFRTILTWLVPLQNEQGLWYAYLDKPDTKIDTSATAGLAAAITWGCRLGIVDGTLRSHAQRAYTRLQTYLTPDGFLTNITQINRGGEDLQQSGYRVMAQFGMGLLGQLKAALNG